MICGQVWWPNLCSAFNTSKCTHTAVSSEQTHTPWTHARSSGQPMLWHPGSSWGSGMPQCYAQGSHLKSWNWKWKARSFTPPTDNPCRTWDSNPRPLGYKSDSLTIRPQLLPIYLIKTQQKTKYREILIVWITVLKKYILKFKFSN